MYYKLYLSTQLIKRTTEKAILFELEKWCEKKVEKNSNNLTREEYEEWKLKFPK